MSVSSTRGPFLFQFSTGSKSSEKQHSLCDHQIHQESAIEHRESELDMLSEDTAQAVVQGLEQAGAHQLLVNV